MLVFQGNTQLDRRVFVTTPYEGMIQLFSEMLRAHPQARAVMQRIDRPGINAMELDEALADHIRTDPVSATESMTITGPSIPEVLQRLREKRANRPAPAPQAYVLPSGYDMVAQAFGDDVYARRRGEIGLVECPGCGYWTPELQMNPSPPAPSAQLICMKKCKESWWIIKVTEHWALFRVTDLLRSHLPRFYLPREWNPSRPWIAYEDLRALHVQWVHKKEAT